MINTTNSAAFDCCRLCMNNPKNNPYANGVCHCTLPYMELYGKTTAVPTRSTIYETGYVVKRTSTTGTFN